MERALPDDIDLNLELIANLMIRVLFIEVQAFHTFAWAEEWLSDTDLVAGDGRAADLVSFIRADETPHVGYLKTALTEMRDRTWIGAEREEAQGHRDDRHPVGPRPRAVARRRPGPDPQGRARRGRALVPRSTTGGADILAEFHALADPEAA